MPFCLETFFRAEKKKSLTAFMGSTKGALGNLARSAVIVFSGTVLGRGFGLLAQILIIQSLAPQTFGHIALAYTIVISTSRIGLLGLHDGVSRLLSSSSGSNKQINIIRSGVLIGMVFSFLLIATLYLFRGEIGGIMNDAIMADYLPLLLPFISFYILGRILFGIIRAQEYFLGGIFARDLTPQIGALLILAGSLAIFKPQIAAIHYWLSVYLIMSIASILLIRNEFGIGELFSESPPKREIKDLWSFSWPLAIGSVVFLFLSNLDILMLGYFSDAKAVGFYRSIQPLKQVTTFVMSSFTFLFLPLATKFYEENKESDLKSLFAVSTKWITAATLPPVLVFTLFADDAIAAFFTQAYVAAAPALSVLMIGLFSRALVGLNGDMVRAIDRTRIELYSSIAGVIVNFIFNIILIPSYGIVGAAIGTVLGYLVYNGTEVVAIYRYTGVHPFVLDNIKQIIPTICLAILMWWLLNSVQLKLLQLVGIGVLLTAFQPLSTVFTGSLSEDDQILITRIEDRLGREIPLIQGYLPK